MQYPHIIKLSPILDLRIPMAFLDTIQRYVGVTASHSLKGRASRQTHSERLPVSHHEWGLVNDAARSQSDFWAHRLLS